jgi:hypothetical protein
MDFNGTMENLNQLHRKIKILRVFHEQMYAEEVEEPALFESLVLEVIGVFEEAGWKIAAAKSSRAKNPKPSAFVRFMCEVMVSLHPKVREHSQSQTAMAKAVSQIIARHRPRPIARDGKRVNSRCKSPATSR